MKKILIALDYSPSAKIVAETGYGLAKALDASVVLLHVIDEPFYYNVPFSIMGYESFQVANLQADTAHIRKQAKEFLTAIALHLGDSRIKTQVSNGNVFDNILSCSKEEHATLIIMGKHRHKGIDKLLSTGTAAHVLKNSPIPLLTIPVEM